MYGGHVVAPCQLAHIGNDEAFHLFPEKVCKSPSIEKPWSLASLVVLGITLRHIFLRDNHDQAAALKAATLTERGLMCPPVCIEQYLVDLLMSGKMNGTLLYGYLFPRVMHLL